MEQLAQAPRPTGGYPLDHVVEADRLGDITAIATLSLRSQRF
jgi:hypothetical protein